MTKDLLDIYSDFLIAQSQYATATSLSNLLEESISHDRFTQFLNKNAFSSKDLWQNIKPKVRQPKLDQERVLIIDDKIEAKQYTDENTIVNWHFCHAKDRCLKGLCKKSFVKFCFFFAYRLFNLILLIIILIIRLRRVSS